MNGRLRLLIIIICSSNPYTEIIHLLIWQDWADYSLENAEKLYEHLPEQVTEYHEDIIP